MTQTMNEDSFLDSLSTLAHSDKKRTIGNERRSRFWFKLETTKQLVKRKSVALAPKTVEHIDAEVEARLKTYEIELTPLLKEKITEVREFFLTEVAPLTLASSGGTMQSKEVIERMLDTKVDTAMIAKFDNMVNRAATLKLALFVLRYFGLGEQHLSAMFAQQQQGNQNPELQQIMEMLKKIQTNSEPNTPVGNVGALGAKPRRHVERHDPHH